MLQRLTGLQVPVAEDAETPPVLTPNLVVHDGEAPPPSGTIPPSDVATAWSAAYPLHGNFLQVERAYNSYVSDAKTAFVNKWYQLCHDRLRSAQDLALSYGEAGVRDQLERLLALTREAKIRLDGAPPYENFEEEARKRDPIFQRLKRKTAGQDTTALLIQFWNAQDYGQLTALVQCVLGVDTPDRRDETADDVDKVVKGGFCDFYLLCTKAQRATYKRIAYKNLFIPPPTSET